MTAYAGRYWQALVRAQPLQWLVRAGFVARGITYGVIGALAIALAGGAGTDGAAPNQQGALSLIARSDVGRPALIVICIGLLAYALWKLYQGVLGFGPEGGGGTGLIDRVGNVGGGVAYVMFFVVALGVLTGSSGNSSSEPHQAAGGVLAWPGGPVIVGLGGAILLGVSLYQLYDAFTGGFLDDAKTRQMDRSERRVYSVFGRVGLSARALVFALIGYFLIRTALDYNARQAVGVDGALGRLHHQPMGVFLVALVGGGLLIFAVFSLFEARYRQL